MYWDDDETSHLSLAEVADLAQADAEMAAWVQDRLRDRLLAGETGFDAMARCRLLRDADRR